MVRKVFRQRCPHSVGASPFEARLVTPPSSCLCASRSRWATPAALIEAGASSLARTTCRRPFRTARAPSLKPSVGVHNLTQSSSARFTVNENPMRPHTRLQAEPEPEAALPALEQADQPRPCRALDVVRPHSPPAIGRRPPRAKVRVARTVHAGTGALDRRGREDERLDVA